MDESRSSVDSCKLSENFADQTECVTTRAMENDSMTGGEPSMRITTATGQPSMLSQSIISLSFRSQSSTDSYDTIFEPRSTNARRSEACQNDQPDNITHSSPSNKHEELHSIRSSSYHVSEVTHETMLLSPRHYPPLQVMDRSAANDVDRTSSSVYTPNNTPQKWSAASTESLFSLHEGRISAILMSNRPSLAAGPETQRTDAKGKEQAGPSITYNTSSDVTVQKIPAPIDGNVRVPEISTNPRKNKGKMQPLASSANSKHKKPSSCCKSLSCCFCSCKSPSFNCCCPSLGFCCSKPKCSCCKMPSCSCSSCCKMPSCSCSNCSLGWCCNWQCCSKKTCCSGFNCCSKWNCSCPKIRSCCPSCSSCSKAICCWNWNCWKLLCSWNCNCCAKTSCWHSWSCCSSGSCCKSWSCLSKGSCCKSWSCCCSKGICCVSWNCCPKGTCCSSWNCCSDGSCGKSWKC